MHKPPFWAVFCYCGNPLKLTEIAMRATLKRQFDNVAGYPNKTIGIAAVIDKNGKTYLQTAIIGKRTNNIASISSFIEMPTIQAAEGAVRAATPENVRAALLSLKEERAVIGRFNEMLNNAREKANAQRGAIKQSPNNPPPAKTYKKFIR